MRGGSRLSLRGGRYYSPSPTPLARDAPRRDHQIDAGPTADSTATTDETITVALGWTDLTLDGVDLPDDDPPAPATVDERADPTDGAFDVRFES